MTPWSHLLPPESTPSLWKTFSVIFLAMNNALSETMLPQISHFPQQMLPLAPLILVDAVLDLHHTLSPLIKDPLIMDITIIVVGGVDVMQLMETHIRSIRCARNLAILLSLVTIALTIPFKVYLPIWLPLLLVLHLNLMLIDIQIRGPPII